MTEAEDALTRKGPLSVDGPGSDHDGDAPLPIAANAGALALETLFASAPVGVGYVDTHVRFLRVNDALADLHGIPAHEHIGRTPDEIVPGAHDVAKSFRVVIETGEPLVNREIVHQDARGRARYWLASFYPVTAGAGTLIGVGCVVSDVTERRRSQRVDAVRHAVERVLAEAEALDVASPKLLEAVCEALGWDVGAMWGFDPHGGVLRCASVWHSPVAARSIRPFVEATRSRVFEPGQGLPGRVWQSGEPIWVSDVLKDLNFPRVGAAEQSGLHTALALPIAGNDEPAGVLEFFTRGTYPPDDDLLVALRSVGTLIGHYVKRKWAEADLHFQRALLHSQSEATSDGIVALSPDGTIASYNRRMIDIWGIPNAALSSTIAETVEAMRARLDPESAPIENVLREGDGGELTLADGRIVEWRSALLRPHGLGRALYFRDVTDQRRSENELIDGRQRFAFLAKAGTLLSSSLHSSAILERLARLAVPTLGDWCAIDEFREDGSLRRLVVTCADAKDKPLARRLKRYAPNPDDPQFEAIRTLTPVLLAGITETELVALARNTSHLQLLRRLGCRSMMIVPLLARGRIFGTITLARSHAGRSYQQDDLDLADELARRAALAIENAALYRERGHIARALQQSLLPPALPQIPRIDLADRYLAAGEVNEVGGDFYDVFETARNDWAIVIGDVCGKGPDAAAVTALARYTIRAAAMNARKPSRVLGVLNGAMLQQGTADEFCRFCTVAYARLKTMRDGQMRLTIASGGHPSPLLLRPDGQVVALSRGGVALGIIDDPLVVDRSTTLEPGDAVIFYTDGVIEARGAAGHIFGSERLESTLQACAGLPATEIADRVHQAVVGFQRGDPRDDIALIVLRVVD